MDNVDAYELHPHEIRDISPEVLDKHGRMRILPASFWAATTPGERRLFGHQYRAYSFPTEELVEHLRGVIAGRTAIEIGAGQGVLAEALGIPATDNHQQEKEPWRSRLIADGQLPIRYGPNVIECDAVRAVRRYRPEIVIACWITHKYLRGRHWAGGNSAGVVEEDVIQGCEQYVFIGNEQVHKDKSIWDLPHSIEYPPWLYSRAMNGTREFIATWRGGATLLESEQGRPGAA